MQKELVIKPSTSHCYFTLTGQKFDSEEVVRRTGIKPPESWYMHAWRKGEPRFRRTKLVMEHDGWSLGTPKEECVRLQDQVARLLDQVEPYRREIEELRREFGLEIEINCSIYLEGFAPEMYFDVGLLDRISRLHAEIDIDLYVLDLESESETDFSESRPQTDQAR